MPTFVNQFRAGGRFPNGSSSTRYDCTVAVGMMALDDFTGGRLRPSATEFRSRQRDQSGGIGLEDVAVVFRSYGLSFTHGSKLWSSIMTRLRAGQPVSLQGWSGALGPYTVGRPVAHAIYVTRASSSGLIIVYDPLRTAPIAMPESIVKRFYLSGLAMAGWPVGTAAVTTPTARPVSTVPAPAWINDDSRILTDADLRTLKAWILSNVVGRTDTTAFYLDRLFWPNPLSQIGAKNYQGRTLGELRRDAPGLFQPIQDSAFGMRPEEMLAAAIGEGAFVLVVGGVIAVLFILGAWRLTGAGK